MFLVSYILVSVYTKSFGIIGNLLYTVDVKSVLLDRIYSVEREVGGIPLVIFFTFRIEEVQE